MTAPAWCIVVSFRSGHRLVALFDSLDEEFGPDGWRMVLVDNSPSCDDAEVASHRNVDYVARPDNPGFGAAVNAGITRAIGYGAGDWLVLLNPDVRIVSGFADFLALDASAVRADVVAPLIYLGDRPGHLALADVLPGDAVAVVVRAPGAEVDLYDRRGRRMGVVPDGTEVAVSHDDHLVITPASATVRLSARTSAGAWSDLPLGAGVIGPGRLVNNAGSNVYSHSEAGDAGFMRLDVGQFSTSAYVPAFCGAAALISTRFIRTVGGLDEAFFLYYEDVDWAARGAARDMRYLFLPSLVVEHEHSASTGEGSEPWSRWVAHGQVVFARNRRGRIGGVSYALFRIGGESLTMMHGRLPIATYAGRVRSIARSTGQSLRRPRVRRLP